MRTHGTPSSGWARDGDGIVSRDLIRGLQFNMLPDRMMDGAGSNAGPPAAPRPHVSMTRRDPADDRP
jgi:hypothetical protein